MTGPVSSLTPLEDKLLEIIQSHCDASVSEIVSGQRVSWRCGSLLEELRETASARDYLDVRNLELERENDHLVTRLQILTGEIEVSPEEQLEIIRQWLANGP